jgi:hypothetical protein
VTSCASRRCRFTADEATPTTGQISIAPLDKEPFSTAYTLSDVQQGANGQVASATFSFDITGYVRLCKLVFFLTSVFCSLNDAHFALKSDL